MNSQSNSLKMSWVAVVIPIIGAIVAAVFVPLGAWEALRPALLPAISIVAAAVLVRLARGLPFTNADHFSLSDFRSVASKLESNARKLRALIFVCLGSVIGLIAFPDLAKMELFPLVPFLSWMPEVINRVLSFLLGGAMVYAFARVIEVVHSDVSLLKLQAKIIETAIAAKNAKNFDEQIKPTVNNPISGAKGFGRPLQ